MTRTSSISGTFVKRQRSPVRVAAARSFRAAFFAPLIGTVPCSGRPPWTRKTSRATGSGWYSQWNGRASATASARHRRACRGPSRWRRSATRIRRSACWSAARAADEVGALVVAALERPFRLAASLLRLLEVDLARHVRRLGHHDDPVRPDLQEAADDGERLLGRRPSGCAAPRPRASTQAERGAAARRARPRSRGHCTASTVSE